MVFELMPTLAAASATAGSAALSPEEGTANYIEAVKKGILKTMSKMGISTISSYRGGGLYEAMGLSRELVDTYFPGTESRVGGIGLEEIEADVKARHDAAYSDSALVPGTDAAKALTAAKAAVKPASVESPWPAKLAALLTKAVREDDAASYRAYSDGITSPERQPFALRDLFEFKAGSAIPLDEVEDVDAIVSRFSIAAMSCGALSPEAHEALAVGANSAGAWSDSGEGGEDPARDKPGPDGVSRASASRQIASARFGVTARYAASARELQIKMAQGAKPGEGGQLPGAKVNEYIAKLRHAVPGTTLISPPPHHDTYSIEDLAQLVHDLRCVNPTARIAVKLAAQAGIGAVAAGTAKAGADCVVVSAGDGGTGSAPMSSLDYAGNAWELALPEIRQVLAMNGLGDRVSIQVDGRLRCGRDVVMAAILGAREFGFGTAALISMGCVACGQCDKDRCPAGIATQRKDLRVKFAGRPEHAARFLRFVAGETREILASIGVRSLDEVTGRYELLDFAGRSRGGRDQLLDFSRVTQALELAKRYLTLETEGPEGSAPLVLPPPPAGLAAFAAQWRSPFRAPDLDEKLIEPVCRALATGTSFKAAFPIHNADRSIGAALSGELVRRGLSGAPGSVRVKFTGSAGQSFGAFLVAGLSFELEGQANDFVGKSLSGGRISVRPSAGCAFAPEANVIAGNVCLIGATSGEVYLSGRVGERFAIRNSGAFAIVEGTGDHGCEYMTGGRVVILGSTGTNFGAGMSGGVAFVLDEDGAFIARIAGDSVAPTPLSDAEDEVLLREDIERHLAATGSPKASAILADWEKWKARFVKVMPRQ
jgi:glutamate synthase (NADPH) large chain